MRAHAIRSVESFKSMSVSREDNLLMIDMTMPREEFLRGRH